MSKGTLQRTIHVACRELGIDNDARHDIQLRLTGKDSMRDMSEGDLRLIIGELKDKGFKIKSGHKHKAAPRADLRLIHVLWRLLYENGVIINGRRAGLNAFIRSQFGNAWSSVPADVDMLRDAHQINSVVRALKSMCHRNGIPHDRPRK